MKYLKTYENKFGKFIGKIKKAKEFAKKAHSGVYRKGVNKEGEKVPYFLHPETVARIVYDVKDSEYLAHLITAAYLHDTIEDTDVTPEQIEKEFGKLVRSLVEELTTNKEKLEISGKEEYLIDKMLNMSGWGLVIKLADRLHNLYDFDDIMEGDDEKKKQWAIKYATQTKNIIDELEWYRELSGTQQVLVMKIKDKLSKII